MQGISIINTSAPLPSHSPRPHDFQEGRQFRFEKSLRRKLFLIQLSPGKLGGKSQRRKRSTQKIGAIIIVTHVLTSYTDIGYSDKYFSQLTFLVRKIID